MDVVGPVCETGDFFARDRNFRVVAEGELLAILDAGAYGTGDWARTTIAAGSQQKFWWMVQKARDPQAGKHRRLSCAPRCKRTALSFVHDLLGFVDQLTSNPGFQHLYIPNLHWIDCQNVARLARPYPPVFLARLSLCHSPETLRKQNPGCISIAFWIVNFCSGNHPLGFLPSRVARVVAA